jgi:hypothetical protein
MGCIGDDEFGRKMSETAKADGVNVSSKGHPLGLIQSCRRFIQAINNNVETFPTSGSSWQQADVSQALPGSTYGSKAMAFTCILGGGVSTQGTAYAATGQCCWVK